MEARDEKWASFSPLQKAFYKIEQYKARIQELEQRQTAPADIAIVGMGLTFPGADTPAAFWNNLLEKRDHIGPFPERRREAARAYLRAAGRADGAVEFLEGAFLDDIDHFDYDFFQLKPKEAAAMHPLQRLFLHTAWRALEDAGYADAENRGNRIGVYLGASGDVTYAQYLDMLEKSDAGLGPAAYAGNVQAITASRISYFLDLRGPALTIDTACSSSLVAVHNACQALRQGDCDVALAGGGRLYLLPESGKYQIGFESPTARTRPFDAAADGAGIGEGVAAIVLKPLSKARRDGDHIYAVIKGSAVNQDGTSAGITAPNLQAQVEVLRQAHHNAGVDPATISFIETHGTGTPLGDPIEFQALAEAFAARRPEQPIALGAVKANLGHLFEAAGIAGLIKCVLALRHRRLPATINHHTPNPDVPFDQSPFFLNTEAIDWPATGAPRRCGVSSFGISGTNAHVILEEYAAAPAVAGPSDGKEDLFALSAKDEEALLTAIDNYRRWLENAEPAPIRLICRAANRIQGNHPWRFAAAVSSPAGLLDALRDPRPFIQGNTRRETLPADAYDAGPAELARHYREGAVIDWSRLYREPADTLPQPPAYPLRRLDCGLSFPIPTVTPAPPAEHSTPAPAVRYTYDELFGKLRDMIVHETGLEADELLPEVDFFNLGIDSLVFIKLIQLIHKEFGVKLDINQFFKQLDNLHKLTEYLVPAIAATEPAGGPAEEAPRKTRQLVHPEQINYFVPYRKIITRKEDRFSPQQLAHIGELTQLVNDTTRQTKVLTQGRRQALANFRNVVGFRPETKELSYQVIARSARGSRIRDLDGNEYVDLTMGFGVNLLGYNPEFINRALREELSDGFPVGPMAVRSGDVARLICELTGVERVSFYNSGSEAVMFALRLAKATTGRSKYVVFKGSYHGTYDGVLALPDAIDPRLAVPMAPGIGESAVSDALVLDYGSDEALAIIREHAHELAAVLVEPVQSRRPDLQPREFLHALRDITEQAGAALIFDEVITGFRIHQGGAQAWFGIRADLVTYGKIVGGGLPIGVVAGKAAFMDAVDGGMWRFGDDSCPDKTTTFVAGTFCEHPLAMRTALETLTYLKEQGNKLQQDLNDKNRRLMERLNAYFRQNGIPIQMVYFGSLFRFILNANWELFYQHLLANGVYVWEGRNCFLSAAHTEEDLDIIFNAAVRAAEAMIAAGWETADKAAAHPHPVPYSEDQESLYSLIRSNEEASSAFNENQVADLHGPLDREALRRAIRQVVNRHEALRVVQLEDAHFAVAASVEAPFHVWDAPAIARRDVDDLIAEKAAEPFDLRQGPFIRFHLFECRPEHHRLLMTVHHLVADGWSIEVIWSEISRLYSAFTGQQAPALPQPFSLSRFNEWRKNGQTADEKRAGQAFWRGEFSRSCPALVLPADKPGAGKKSMRGASFSMPVDTRVQQYLTQLASHEKTTLFHLLLAGYNLLLHQLSNQDRFVVGVPAAGQLQIGESCLVGQCVKMLPFYNQINPEWRVKDYIRWVRTQLGQIIRHENTSFTEVLNAGADLTPPLFSTAIDMNAVRQQIRFGDLDAQMSFPPASFVKYDLSLSIIELDGRISADFYFNTDLFNEATVQYWAQHYLSLLEDMALHPEKGILDLTVGREQDADNFFSTWNNL